MPDVQVREVVLLAVGGFASAVYIITINIIDISLLNIYY